MKTITELFRALRASVSSSTGTPLDDYFQTSTKLRIKNGYLVHGIVASAVLTAAYFIIVSIFESFDHAVNQFVSLSFLFIPLITSFGIQIALFSFARYQSKLARQSSSSISSTGSMTTVSMILCCAHHISDIAAFVGLTAATLFLATYQPVFLLMGLVSNVIGILTILLFIQKNALYYKQGFFSLLMRLNLSKTRKLTAITAVLVVIIAFAFVAFNSQNNQQTYNSNPSGIFALPSKSVSQNGLTIVASPQPFKYGDSVQIGLALDTHSGELSYDLTKLATLQDSDGGIYNASWSGSSPGGHHVSGKLIFSSVKAQSSFIKLYLNDIYGADWNFEWNLS